MDSAIRTFSFDVSEYPSCLAINETATPIRLGSVTFRSYDDPFPSPSFSPSTLPGTSYAFWASHFYSPPNARDPLATGNFWTLDV